MTNKNKDNAVMEDEGKKQVTSDVSGKTVKELGEIAQTLETQLQEYQKQANHFQTMAVKAQGALEVILQLLPEKEAQKRNNGEVS
tara:strand:+ start:86 stop:340 length:255 start_codon:yes stop_codon:yes gene_type:complete